MTNEPEQPKGGDDHERTDAAFEAIVSSLRDEHLREEQGSGDAPWPAAEGSEQPDDEPAPGTREPRPSRMGSDWSGWEDVIPDDVEEPEELDEDEGHHFVPPTPPPIPRGDRVIRWAWAGALGAPALLALFFVLGWTISELMGLALVAMFLTGFGTLIARMRPTRSDDGDDGAVV